MDSDDSNGSRGYVSDFSSPCSVSPQSSIKIELSNNEPYLQIVEQPGDFRYRYEKERYHGYILGLTSPNTKKKHQFKFPSVKVHNYPGNVIIRCWLITADLSKGARAHVHKLCRKLPKLDVETEPLDIFATSKNMHTATFDYMYIVHAVGGEESHVQTYDKKRQWLEADSFSPAYNALLAPVNPEELKQIDKNQSILYFEAYDANTKERICKPVVSRKVNNLHNPEYGILKIVNYSRTSGSCRGGEEVFMFVEKISKGVGVKFFSCENGSYTRTWEENAVLGPQSIHHQYGIVFKTPRYHNVNLTSPVPVFIELYRESDGAKSEPVKFTYTPDVTYHVHDFNRKRPHNSEDLYSRDVMMSSGSPKKIKENISPEFSQSSQILDIREVDLYSGCLSAFEIDPHLLDDWLDSSNSSVKDLIPDFNDLLADPNLTSDSTKINPEKHGNLRPKISELSNGIERVQIDVGPKKSSFNLKQYILKKILLYAVIHEGLDKIEKIKDLLKNADFDWNEIDCNGNTIFLLSCMLSTPEAVSRLLSFDLINVDAMNFNGDGALHCACLSGKTEIVKILLKKHFHPNTKNYKSGDTPLHIAVQNENLALIKLLIQNGANPLENNFSSISAYDLSTFSENLEIENYLYLKAQDVFTKKYGSQDFMYDVTANLQRMKVTC